MLVLLLVLLCIVIFMIYRKLYYDEINVTLILLSVAILIFLYFLSQNTTMFMNGGHLNTNTSEKTICQKAYDECMSDKYREMVDNFCYECDADGNYKSNTWSHPLSKNQCCRNIKTGELYNCVNRDTELIC